MARLVLAAPAYFTPSQRFRRAHCLLRSAASSACGTVSGTGTEMDLAKKKPKQKSRRLFSFSVGLQITAPEKMWACNRVGMERLG